MKYSKYTNEHVFHFKNNDVRLIKQHIRKNNISSLFIQLLITVVVIITFGCSSEQKPTENKNNNISEQSNSEVSDKWSQYIDKKGVNEKDQVEKSVYSDNQFADLIPEQSDSGNEPRYIFEDETSPPNPDDIIWDDDIFEKTLKKAEQGDSDAQFKIAQVFNFGLEGNALDLPSAISWYQKAAVQGHAKAQFNLAVMYYKGEGVQKDFGNALELYQMAAEQGYADAQFNLALMYQHGEGINHDSSKAAEWYYKATGKKFSSETIMSYYVAREKPKDIGAPLEWYQVAAEYGYANAQFNLALLYENGEGVPKDIGKAIEWYQKAAKQGYPEAQNNLALMYNDGKGVPQDFKKAVEWYQKAAKQGEANAQNNLALMYYTGEGIPKDQVLAYAWANLAGVKKNTPDKKLRDIIAENISPAEIAEGQRLSSNWKPGMILARENHGHGNTTPTPDKGNENTPIKFMTGTGFVISKKGHILTNNHVIEDSSEIRIAGIEGRVKILATDAVNDLALLQVDTRAENYAIFAPDAFKLGQGEDIIVFGYPLNSVLSSSGNLTPGTISALTGIGNNTNQLQITAPIQPGSSGSPVINKKGNIVGIVSMKLSDGFIANETGSIPQNVNFAVNLQTVKSFMNINNVPYKTGASLLSLNKNSTDIAEEAKKWTVIIECWK